jgi:hypothetical protein
LLLFESSVAMSLNSRSDPATSLMEVDCSRSTSMRLRKDYPGKTVTAGQILDLPTQPNDTESLAVGLVAFSNPPLSLRLDAEVRSSPISFCKSGNGKSPERNMPIASIPGGRIVRCFPTTSGVVGVAAFFSRANVFTALATSVLNAPLLPIASAPYTALSGTNFGTK